VRRSELSVQENARRAKWSGSRCERQLFSGELHWQAFTDYKAGSASLLVSETSCSLRVTASPHVSTVALARYLPSTITQYEQRIMDDFLVASVAGCAGGGFHTDLAAATQGRCLPAMSFGSRSPPWGGGMTAPAKRVCSVAAVKRSISEMVATLEQRGTEPSAHPNRWCSR